MTQIWCVYQQSAIAKIWNFHTEQQQTSLYLIRSSRKITWTIKNPPRVMAPQNHVVSMLQNLRPMDQQSVTRESAPRTINYNLIYNFKYQFATIRKLSVHNSPHDFPELRPLRGTPRSSPRVQQQLCATMHFKVLLQQHTLQIAALLRDKSCVEQQQQPRFCPRWMISRPAWSTRMDPPSRGPWLLVW